jgi:alpha-N-arabinofuranosidase
MQGAMIRRAPGRGLAVLVLALPALAHGQGPAPAAGRIVIDAAQTGAPIAPRIYGQFIEHLGRCIYGGLWAEMLEDRKFFYPVTGEAPAWEMTNPGQSTWEGEGHPYEVLVRSPWMVLGDKKNVRMAGAAVGEAAFTGAHSPELESPGGKAAAGLMQERLVLGEGRDYVGRIVLAGDPASAAVEVSLVWGGGASARQSVRVAPPGRGWKTVPFRFRAGRSTDNGRLEIVVRGAGAVRVGAVSLMPADNVHGWRADTLARLRELGATVYRWPGGNFVSGYDWKDGIGDPDRRPPRKNPAWKGVEPNDVGLHEFMDLMQMLGAEPYVAVNTGLGGAGSAAELVEYANGRLETPMGRLRARNGHPRPFGVQLWAVGNEMYGQWQLGHMPLSDYLAKHREIVRAMRAVDPKIELVAVGAVGEWSRTMLAQAASDMTFMSEHNYWQGKDDVAAHVAQVPAAIRKLADAYRGYRRDLPALAGTDVRIAFDEWNYWYGPFEYGELGVRYSLKDALGIAAGLHELFRNSDLFAMANCAQTVNVLGAIKTSGDAAELEPNGLVLALYRHHFGTLPVTVRAAPKPLDVAAAWTTSARDALTIAVVNPTASPQRLQLEAPGVTLAGPGRRFVVTGAGPLAHNDPGHPRGVDVAERALANGTDPLEVPAFSVALFVLGAERASPR